MIRILLVEDDLADQVIFERTLKQCELDVELVVCQTLAEVGEHINSGTFQMAFCDYNLPDGTALQLIDSIAVASELPVVVITSQGDIKRATESLKKGAFDFITKDQINVAGLERTIFSIERIRAENTIRKQLERKLEENYANTRAILENTVDGIWSVDRDGRVQIINSVAKWNMEHHLGKVPEVGDAFFEQLTEPYLTDWKGLYDEALKGEHVMETKPYRTPMGEFYLELSCSPIISQKMVTGVTFFARNVTKREQADRVIKEKEQNFRVVFENSDLPIMLESKADHLIVDLNEACAELHGYSREEMIGMNILDTIPPDHLEQSQINYKRFLSGELDELNSFALTKDGSSVPINISISEVVYDGKPCNLLYMQDLAVRMEVERKLEEARESAEQSAEFKARFLANMSHEIRTPMNALIGFADLLLKTDLDTAQQEYASVIKESGDDLLVIINDILDLSKLEAGKMELLNEAFSPDEEFRKIERTFKYKADDKGIELNMDVDCSPDPVLVGDSGKLVQIGNNLVSNAIKFTESGSVNVNVRTRRSSGQVMLEIEVTDTGIGIDESQLDLIFQDFTQIDSGVQRKHTGTGLGLTIVSKLIDLMGGSIDVHSAPGVGTTFGLSIPFLAGQADDLSYNSQELDRDLSGLRIVVCEDNETNILLARRVLEGMNTRVRFARNGQEGVDLVKEEEPDLVLMDIQMPGMDGFEATRRIKEFSNVPIYAMTAHVMQEQRDQMALAGMAGFIPKPFKAEDLLNNLGKVKPSQHGPAAPVTDLGMPHLERLADGDMQFVRGLFGTFLDSSAEDLAALDAAISTGDMQRIGELAHKLRSSFVVFSFDELHAMSVALEEDGATLTMASEFSEAVQQSRTMIKSKLDQLS